MDRDEVIERLVRIETKIDHLAEHVEENSTGVAEFRSFRSKFKGGATVGGLLATLAAGAATMAAEIKSLF